VGGGGKAPGKSDLFWRWSFGFSADWISCGEPRPRQVSLSGVRVIMTFMCVLMVKSQCQMTTGQIPALECQLLGARGSQ
jgi:hypothetical protein